MKAPHTERKWMGLAVLLLLLIAGPFTDLFINGFLKIIWPIIYIPIYVVLGKVVTHSITNTIWNNRHQLILSIFYGSALCSHLLFVNKSSEVQYEMLCASSSPITLQSKLWPEALIVSSDTLAKKIQPGISAFVAVHKITDYGCIRTFTVSAINGVDVEKDPLASWTWKTSSTTSDKERPGPDEEDQILPWCRFKFYRS